ncbi:sugar ABC transporter permease [Conexibacter stalactiti]|uniref:Sugar ABC transporter permease n=1 Tax=Conexibacter stalactiti TaxID=1940611 RepID=A0ABU4HVP0_9ACTN|nr:sugar ABC transporter permease [Conexibacter stalactiti]MDW5597392.1 sugar ABC transporter permease [Conexibacter stalactiti]MEC5038034.1 sugar ABC transporter permease [Conexibacter stalactiti]
MAVAVRRRGTSAHLRARRRLGWLFLAPLLVVNVLVIIGPSIAALYYSFTDWSGIGEANWIGLDNYTRLLEDPAFRSGLLHNLQWTAIFLTVPMAMALAGAFLLSRVTRFRLLFRVAFFVPYVIASVVSASIWENLLDPQAGIGSALGIPGLEGTSFFGDPSLALPAVAFVDIWHFWGFLLVLFLASMQSIDRELYEAARVDGAGLWREFRDITLPGIRPTLVFAVVLVTIWSFLTFDYVYIITEGGPAGATETAATLLYKNVFEYNEAGYAAAMGLTLSVVAFVVMAFYGIARKLGWRV